MYSFISSFDRRFSPASLSATCLGDSLGIYSMGSGTDITANGGLDFSRLVRTEAVFLFTSSQDLDSLSDTWVQGGVAFGFGTGPDLVLLPEPGSLSIAALGGLVAAGWRRTAPLPAARRTNVSLPMPGASATVRHPLGIDSPRHA
jgi:hypothetical protein